MLRRHLGLLLALLAGCSTHPIGDTCDFFKPGHLYPNKVNPYGGVCIPQGMQIQGTSPSAPPGPVIPPPAPLPPPGPAVSVPNLPPPPGSVNPIPSTLPTPNFPTAPR
jgi:hypothetical protein